MRTVDCVSCCCDDGVGGSTLSVLKKRLRVDDGAWSMLAEEDVERRSSAETGMLI